MSWPPPFQAFLDDHGDLVGRFLRGLVGPGEAEDCAQETFLAALRAWPQLAPGTNLRAWVLTIARHKAIDGVRARRRQAQPNADAGTWTQATGADPASSPIADPELWGAVGSLPEKQRAAIVLRYVGDLSHREVAAALGCSEAAARRSAFEGLKKLKEVYA